MTKPRCVLPGIAFVTRRCSERRLFLRPDPTVTHIFEYLLAHFAKVHQIEIHAYVAMSNHYHLVVTDTAAKLPDFQRDLNANLARSINAFRGREESLWDRRSYNLVKPIQDQDVLAKLAYTIANPVEARLVNRARQWMGATSAGMKFGRPRPITRPREFFAEDKLPAEVELVLTRPRCYEELSDSELLARIEVEVARAEDEHAQDGKAMGMSRVMRQDWRTSPTSDEERGGLRPTIACKDKRARIEAIARSKEWLAAYYESLKRFISGERDVEFPPGTWWMAVRLGCRVALE